MLHMWRASEVTQAPAQAGISGSDKTEGSRRVSDQVMIRDAVQHTLEGSAAQPAMRTRQSKRSLHVSEGPGHSRDTPQPTGVPEKERHLLAAGQGALCVEHGSGEASPPAPETPEYRLKTQGKTRQGKTRQKSSAR